jgi:hypothetical protein
MGSPGTSEMRTIPAAASGAQEGEPAPERDRDAPRGEPGEHEDHGGDEPGYGYGV